MEIKGVGAFTHSVKPSGKQQSPSGAAEPAAKGSAGAQGAVSGGAPAWRLRVQAKDLLSEEEQRYLESLFPGATGGSGAGETYAGKGRPGAVPPGTLVDRKG